MYVIGTIQACYWFSILVIDTLIKFLFDLVYLPWILDFRNLKMTR